MTLPPFLAQMPSQPLRGLAIADQLWLSLRQGNLAAPTVVSTSTIALGEPELDVIIGGGTLGILLATALQKRGLQVALIEKGLLRGREQEWNISRQELEVFLELDLLSPTELQSAIATEFAAARLSFHESYEFWVREVLNIGVEPVFLLAILKDKFLAAGGILWENCLFQEAIVHEEGVKIKVSKNGVFEYLSSKIFIDAMGHFSPLVRQARQGQKPDAVCLVVGTCAQGYVANETGDLIATCTPILNHCQYFWEAFPARDGRTTYLFTYVDCHPQRFSLEYLLAEYFRYLPQYQNCDLAQLACQRVLFGFFPAYRQSPLTLPWPRILAVGDSAGAQSPISFGGFGALVRHLPRLTAGITAVLALNDPSVANLRLLQPYQPNIAVTWLFQKTMSVELGQKVNPNQINELMAGVFQVMDSLGEEVLHPFLKDVIQWGGLTQTLPRVDPRLILPLLPQIGLGVLADWLKHYLALGLYTGLTSWGEQLDSLSQQWPPQYRYLWQQYLQAWRYGSGLEH